MMKYLGKLKPAAFVPMYHRHKRQLSVLRDYQIIELTVAIFWWNIREKYPIWKSPGLSFISFWIYQQLFYRKIMNIVSLLCHKDVSVGVCQEVSVCQYRVPVVS